MASRLVQPFFSGLNECDQQTD